MNRPLFVSAVVLLFTASVAAEDRTNYRFFLDGEFFTPAFIHLDGDEKAPAPTDLMAVNDVLLVVGKEKEQRFHTDKNDRHILWIERNGKRQPVAVRVRREYTEEDEKGKSKQVLVNPLAKLSTAEIGALRGISLDTWAEELNQQLAGIQPDTVCVTLSENAGAGASKSIPPLPTSLRYLSVRERSNFTGIKDYSPLIKYTRLRFLFVDSMNSDFDCAVLRQSTGLVHLTVSAQSLKGTDGLVASAKLRSLALPFEEGLNQVNFVKELKELRTLDIRGTAVTDLSMLSGHPALEAILASQSQLRKLPLDKPVVTLKTFTALSTMISEKDVEAFEKINPQCQLQSKWGRALTKAVANADRLRVRSGGTCHRDIASEKTLYDEKDVKQIGEFLGHISIHEKTSGFHCMCCGDPSFEFYQGGKLILTIGYHHGQSLRWPGGWPGDAALTGDSARFLNQWLRDRVPEIRESQDRQLANQKKEAEAYQRFVNCFPKQARALFQETGQMDMISAGGRDRNPALGKRFIQAVGGDQEVLVAACKAFGTQEGWNSSWTTRTNKETLVLAGVLETGADSFAPALAALKDDRKGMLGAARIFFNEEFGQRLPEMERTVWLLKLA